MEENKEITLIKPPAILMILPVVAGGLGLYYARKKKSMSWFNSILLGGGASIVGSAPSMIWAYNINKQYILQNKEK